MILRETNRTQTAGVMLVLATVLLTSERLEAASVTYQISGTSSLVIDNDGIFPGVILGVTTFTGSFRYETDPNAYDEIISPNGPTLTNYRSFGGAASLAISLDGLPLAFGTGPNVAVLINNDAAPQNIDQFLITSLSSPFDSLRMNLQTPSPGPFSDRSLPNSLELADFEIATISILKDSSLAWFEIESMVLVPEPSTCILAFLGIAALLLPIHCRRGR